MTDDLRTRIAAALSYALPDVQCERFLDAADAVIRELGLRQEWAVQFNTLGCTPPMTKIGTWSCGCEQVSTYKTAEWRCERMNTDDPEYQAHPAHRYVTEWTADEIQ